MTKPILVLVLCTLITLSLGLTLVPLAPKVSAETTGAWAATTSYPTSVVGNSCAVSDGFIYCVGGSVSGVIVDHVYSAPVSSAGVGTWTNTTAYPIHAYLPSCVIAGAFITCVGGSIDNDTFSAPISGASVGTWVPETDYPTDVEATSCVTSDAFITCVGGLTGIDENTNAVFSASLLSGTVGAWTATTSYPVSIEATSCVTSGAIIACVGGQTDPSESNFITNSVHYDTITAGALDDPWDTTVSYPVPISFTSCVVDSGLVYCVGGYSGTGSSGVYSDTVPTGEAGSWTTTTSYPIPVEADQCVTSGGFIYCAGGFTDSVYYSLIGADTVGSTTTTIECLPATVAIGVESTCTARVTGDFPSGIVSWTQSSTDGGVVTFSSSTCEINAEAFVQSGGMHPLITEQNSCSVTLTGEANGGVSITGTYSGDDFNTGSADTGGITVGSATPPVPAPTLNPCESGISCYSTFVQFSDNGTVVNAIAHLSGSTMPTAIVNTTCSLKYTSGTVIAPTWIAVPLDEPVHYVVTLVNGTELSGTVTVSVPWSVYNVNI